MRKTSVATILTVLALTGLISGSTGTPDTAPQEPIAAPVSVVAAALDREPDARDRWSTGYTNLHAAPWAGSAVVRLVPVAAPLVHQGREFNGMVLVSAGPVGGWIPERYLADEPPHRNPGPFTLADHTADVVFEWCPGVTVETYDGHGGRAVLSVLSDHPGAAAFETTRMGTRSPTPGPLDPAGELVKATALHQCAHLLQFRAYGYDTEALNRDMNRIYPDGQHSGLEHMADCMADEMGAQRTSHQVWEGTVHMIELGYGGDYTPEQYEAARRLIAGSQIAPENWTG